MIEFVGGNFASGTATSFTVNLQALTSGIDTRARSGDLVVAMTSYGAGTGSATNIGISGVSAAEYIDLFKSTQIETVDPSMAVAYKYLNAEDATCLVYGAAGGRVGVVSVWRNVDPTTPLIAGESGLAKGNNSPLPVFPAVTPSIPGSTVLAVGCGSVTSQGTQFSMGAGYTRCAGAQAAIAGTTSGICGAIGHLDWPGYAAETPGSWTGPTDTNAEGWIAVTLVLNPLANRGLFVATNT